MRVIVHGRAFNNETKPFIEEVLASLVQHDAQIAISKDFFSALKGANIETPDNVNLYEANKDVLEGDFFLSLGGDGTLLESVTHIGRSEVPILGINTGRLGFLATTKKTEISRAIDHLMEGSFTLDRRVLLRLDSDLDIFGSSPFALNEFTILKKDTSSMIVVEAFIDGEYISSYWADGLIVSTATGSTGYSLSCGGPVVLPGSDNFIITPVNPHNLTMRPLVVSSDSVISFKIGGRDRNFLVSLDSRSNTVEANIKIAVRKEDFGVNLIRLSGADYFNTLRQKLNWGLDLRN